MNQVFKPTRLSIVTPVLNSHAIVTRHVLHYKRMDLPNDIEIIIIDDGSKKPLKQVVNTRGLKNFYIYPTGDTRPWTIACARNLGIKIAQGQYILNTDIDHVFNKEAVMAAYEFNGDKMFFRRFYGALDNRGRLRKDPKYLFSYGMPRHHYKKRGLKRYYHVGTHCIKKKIVEKIDGYPERTCNYGTHPTREDRLFYHRYKRLKEAGRAKEEVFAELPAAVYMFPASDPRGYFHELQRKTSRGWVNYKKDA
jgi:glycosyltransferase involved in cell wall biosynthesis